VVEIQKKLKKIVKAIFSLTGAIALFYFPKKSNSTLIDGGFGTNGAYGTTRYQKTTT